MTPERGQVWQKGAGSRTIERRIVYVGSAKVEYTFPPLHAKMGWCLRKTWDRWARKAKIVERAEP